MNPSFSINSLVLQLIGAVLFFLPTTFAQAVPISAEWKPNPTSGDWNTTANWTSMPIPNVVPNGPNDTATFGTSSMTSVSISANTQVNGITFTSVATKPSFTITANPGLTLTLSGAGITNNSGVTQNFVINGAGNNGVISFTNRATAGTSTLFTNNAGAISNTVGGITDFRNSSTAGSGSFINNGAAVFPNHAGSGFTRFSDRSTAATGTFTNNGGAVAGAIGGFTEFHDTSKAGGGTFTSKGGAVADAFGGATQFSDSSTAGTGTFTNNPGEVAGAFGGGTQFFDSSTAGSGTFTNNGSAVAGAIGGFTAFSDTSTADSATLIANGGTNDGQGGRILFEDASDGGTSRVIVRGNGTLDLSKNTRDLTIGSLEGDGSVTADNAPVGLNIGTNNSNTTFSGSIDLSGGGELHKVGTGRLTFSSDFQTGSGDIRIKGGVLQVDGSLVGGNVEVEKGATLAGSGSLNGDLTVEAGAKVRPGSADAPGTLTVGNYLPSASASLIIQIRSATDFSKLMVTGEAFLDGTLEVELLNQFIPKETDMFTFLFYDGHEDTTFSKIANENFSDNLFWVVDYEDTMATLEVIRRLPGVPDQGSTLLLLMLGLGGLLTYRRQLLREQL